MKKIIILFLISFIFAKTVYFMPEEGKEAQKTLYKLFSNAKQIKMIIYTFTNKKLAKALKIAAKKGAKIEIIADKKESKYKYSIIPNLSAIKNINTYLLLGKKYKNGEKAKMHIKMTIIDNKYLITGSANYSYSAFYKNYEYILIQKDKNLIKQFNNFFDKIKKRSTPYRFSQ